MKKTILTLLTAASLLAVDSIKLQFLEINVNHTYSNSITKPLIIQREVDGVCIDIPINVQTIQSLNLASNDVDAKCKKSFVTTKGLIQPLNLLEGVKTVAELEVLDFILNKSSTNPSKYILVDSRKSDWFDAGTIPSAINIPFDELEFDEDFQEEYERAYKNLGIKILKGNKLDFTDAKTVIFFCNASWCSQSPRAIKKLIKFGYPKEKILWYRGGIAAWAGVSLTLTENIGN